jgi:hypothetical protein
MNRSLNEGRFQQVCAMGDRFLREGLAIHVAIGGGIPYRRPDPPSRGDFDRAFDDFAMKHCSDWPHNEINLLHSYAEAAAGLALKKRRRLIVWRDDANRFHCTPPPWPQHPLLLPPLHEHPTVCDADLLREAGAPAFFED